MRLADPDGTALVYLSVRDYAHVDVLDDDRLVRAQVLEVCGVLGVGRVLTWDGRDVVRWIEDVLERVRDCTTVVLLVVGHGFLHGSTGDAASPYLMLPSWRRAEAGGRHAVPIVELVEQLAHATGRHGAQVYAFTDCCLNRIDAFRPASLGFYQRALEGVSYSVVCSTKPGTGARVGERFAREVLSLLVGPLWRMDRLGPFHLDASNIPSELEHRLRQGLEAGSRLDPTPGASRGAPRPLLVADEVNCLVDVSGPWSLFGADDSRPEASGIGAEPARLLEGRYRLVALGVERVVSVTRGLRRISA